MLQSGYEYAWVERGEFQNGFRSVAQHYLCRQQVHHGLVGSGMRKAPRYCYNMPVLLDSML